ncbi:MAG: bifunctional 5,10-methylenetetrahydrofolate dehydrogenase/5,10-methenyltetrahydrofolate cyclohydrolase [Deltaproteobacteria bacterium]|nr:bifunctional 5,10-methylenetetrahydrofolate dehydrogenase/5,10-methenyltetrahydrofolate cyclohydrolase [Deltaproteobacteria bacterium]
MYKIIDGKIVSKKIREEIQQKTSALYKDKSVKLKLATILVGNDPASKIYIKNKINACSEAGIESEHIDLPATTPESELLGIIDKLNGEVEIDGILVQLPLPSHISADKVTDKISPDKDVDGFHPYNQGRLLAAKDYDSLIKSGIPIPCTPYGCLKLLEYYNIDISGKRVAILGRSNIVGKPLSLLFLLKNATVTICHSKTKDAKEIIREADIVVCATGKRGLLNGDMVKEGVVLLDVGINRGEDGKIYGDADFESVKEKASFITPVPGGVGPMTITMLLYNTLTLGLKRRGIINI